MRGPDDFPRRTDGFFPDLSVRTAHRLLCGMEASCDIRVSLYLDDNSPLPVEHANGSDAVLFASADERVLHAAEHLRQASRRYRRDCLTQSGQRKARLGNQGLGLVRVCRIMALPPSSLRLKVEFSALGDISP